MALHTNFQCEYCKGAKFIPFSDSILKRRYKFLENFELKACAGCGVKYLVCPKCHLLLTPIHLSLDPFGLKYRCNNCNYEIKVISDWIRSQQY